MLNKCVQKRAVLVAILALAACTSEHEVPVAKTPPAATTQSVAPKASPPLAPKTETPPAFPTLNKLAPEIVGEDIDGKPIKLSDYRGKVVMLDFWGHW